MTSNQLHGSRAISYVTAQVRVPFYIHSQYQTRDQSNVLQSEKWPTGWPCLCQGELFKADGEVLSQQRGSKRSEQYLIKAPCMQETSGASGIYAAFKCVYRDPEGRSATCMACNSLLVLRRVSHP